MSESVRLTNHVEIALEKASWQPALFAGNLRRFELMRLQPTWPVHTVSLRVHRNQPFELITMAMPPFLAYGDLALGDVSYSDYDDSLVFAEQANVDVEIVSLDFERYRDRFGAKELIAWLTGRVRALRAITNAPILITNWPARNGDNDGDSSDEPVEVNRSLADAFSNIPAVRICDVASIAAELGDAFYDDRTAEIKASRWSDQAVLQMARAMATRWIPGVVMPGIKAVVVDLDATLYDGVLAEDGIDGIVLRPEHQELQQRLIELTQQGVFLAAVSRNELEDVQEMFRRRTDFPLRMSHFSTLIANWSSKAHNIVEVANSLRIGTDSMVFIDDNPGELGAVVQSVHDIKTIHAQDPHLATRTLASFPGLFTFETRAEDRLRATDLAAIARRESELAMASDESDYVRSLDIELRFRVDDLNGVTRMAELAAKTNQFNTSLRRTSEAELVEGLVSGRWHAVTAALSDKLSDSGTIAFVLIDGEVMEVEELCISCRALGRQLEDVVALEALRLVVGERSVSQVTFRHQVGPRNQPALQWLHAHASPSGQDGAMVMSWDDEGVRKLLADTPVRRIHER